MDEKEKDKKETKGKGKEETVDDTETGDKPEEDKTVDESERLAETERRLAVLEASGKAEAGLKEPEKKPETDEEYADKVSKGLANPLKDDGFVS